VLSLAAIFVPVSANNLRNITDIPLRHRREQEINWSYYKEDFKLLNPGELLTPKDNQKLLRDEARYLNRTNVDCCPAVLEMIEPRGGRNLHGVYVSLYREANHVQRFFELSCHKDILNKPCRFMERRLHSSSKCVQKYSYTYALVKEENNVGNGGVRNFPSISLFSGEKARWTLDYIQVRSGCSCEVTHNKKKRGKEYAGHNKRHNPH